jgi:hypothetical protein
MKNGNMQAIPKKRTERTYRTVLQAYDPATGRYRDAYSVRLEAPVGDTLERIIDRWKESMNSFLGRNK